MKKVVVLLSVSLLAYNPVFSQSEAERVSDKPQENDHYELLIPEGNQTSVLILFPGFPETPEVIRRELKIVDPAIEARIVVAQMNFNRKLWLEDEEKE